MVRRMNRLIIIETLHDYTVGESDNEGEGTDDDSDPFEDLD